LRTLILTFLMLMSIQIMADDIYLTTRGVNLRKGPDNKKKVLTTVPGNKQINVLELTNEWWWKVEYEGTTGYIAKDFIKISYPLSTVDFIKKNPTATAAIGLLLFAFLYLLSSGGKSAAKSPLKKRSAKVTKKKK
jgi:uncharacterized protein YgiM (DUF1202 family)